MITRRLSNRLQEVPVDYYEPGRQNVKTDGLLRN